MKSLSQFIKEQLILERFVNALSKEEMQQYKNEVWKIVQKAYEYCGGVAGVDSVDDLVNDSSMWKMVRRSGRIVAVAMYSNKRGGRKAICIASTPDEEGKAGIKKIMQEDFRMKDREAWYEVSGAAEVTALRQNAYPIPAEMVKILLLDKKIEKVLDDGYHYVRKIGPDLHTKLMCGTFKDSSIVIDDDLRNELIATAKKIGSEEFNKK